MVDPTEESEERGGNLSRSSPSAFIVFGAAEHANMLKLCNCDWCCLCCCFSYPRRSLAGHTHSTHILMHMLRQQTGSTHFLHFTLGPARNFVWTLFALSANVATTSTNNFWHKSAENCFSFASLFWHTGLLCQSLSLPPLFLHCPRCQINWKWLDLWEQAVRQAVRQELCPLL